MAALRARGWHVLGLTKPHPEKVSPSKSALALPDDRARRRTRRLALASAHPIDARTHAHLFRPDLGNWHRSTSHHRMNCRTRLGYDRHRGHKTECLEGRVTGSWTAFVGAVELNALFIELPSCKPVMGAAMGAPRSEPRQ